MLLAGKVLQRPVPCTIMDFNFHQFQHQLEVELKQILQFWIKHSPDAAAAAEGIDVDGGLWYEKKTGLTQEKHCWPQAEAVVGFLNAYSISSEEKFMRLALDSWRFIQEYLIDRNFGEWHWGITATGKPMPGMDKLGLWKCPYHNSRACMESVRLLHQINQQQN